MKNPDPHILRLIDSISECLDKKIELTESDSSVQETGLITVPGGSASRMALRSISGETLSERERELLTEVLALISHDQQSRSELIALDQRLRLLERENVDLSMKNRALAEASSKDSLTGLFNRWYVLSKIEEEMGRALRHGSSMSVLMMDVDHFKAVNDSYGHSVGDQVLQAVGQVLRDSCRVYDIPGRYGGEEFCLMLPETKLEGTLPVAERIRRRMEGTPFQCAGNSIRVTASIGIAGLESVPDEGLYSPASLIERADRALYVAKDRGRNRTEVWTAAFSARVVEH